jgi:multiple sugar transport system substrate-binding protein
MWHQENTAEAVAGFQAVLDQFNASQDQVVVEQQANDWQEIYGKLTAALATGNQPDLAFTIPDHTVTIRQAGGVQPVDDFVTALEEKHGFIESYVTPYQYDDHIWAIPAFGLNHILWLRMDKLEAAGIDPPETWDELLAAAEALTTEGTYGMGLPASTHLYTDQAIYDFMITNHGEELFAEDGSVRFNNPETIEALAFYQELYQFSPPDSTGWGFAEPIGSFINGTVAMVFHMGHLFNFWEEGTGLPPEQLGGVPVPQPPGGQRGSVSYSNGIMVLTDDPVRQEAIMTFLDWLFEPANNGAWLATMTPGLFLPVTQDVSESEEFWQQPKIATFRPLVELNIENAEYGKLYGFTGGTPNPNIGRISSQNILAKVVQRLVIDGASPEEAADWGQSEMEAAIQ